MRACVRMCVRKGESAAHLCASAPRCRTQTWGSHQRHREGAKCLPIQSSSRKLSGPFIRLFGHTHWCLIVVFLFCLQKKRAPYSAHVRARTDGAYGPGSLGPSLNSSTRGPLKNIRLVSHSNIIIVIIFD